MKIAKVALLILSAAAMLLSLASCDAFHQHEWQYRVAKDATCQEKGLLELLCITCGEKEYADLAMDTHTYANGICTSCGAYGSSTPKQMELVALPAGTSTDGEWSLGSIYDLACTIDYAGDYDSFVSSLSGSSLRHAYLDSLGLFHVTVSVPLADGGTLETPLALPIEKVAVTNPLPSLGRLLRADVKEGELIFTYADASQCSAGKFTGLRSITGFGISTAGDLVIFYSSGMVAFAGTIG